MATELDANDTNALLNEIDVLRERLAGVDRAKARIEKWHDRLPGYEASAKVALEEVFRIFDEEMNI